VLTSLSVAFAAEGAPADTSISVSGLETGDTVNFYQVLKYDETATATGGWVATTAFAYDATNNTNGLTTDDIQKIVGKGDYATGKTKANQAGIDAAIAGRISLLAQATGVTPKFAGVSASSGTATQATTNVGDAGLYLALVAPGTVDYLYNPVFVAADYTAAGTNTQAATTALSYEPAALAKKEQVTLTKEIDGTDDTKYDVNVGDDVDFTITSKVPAFSTAYQEPTYFITDKMESGLELKSGTINVAIAGLTGDNALAAADYTISYPQEGDTSFDFKVTLNASGLAKVRNTGVAQEIVVTYTATVTSLEDFTVTEKENEATVQFSNNPDDASSYSLLEDKTRTYSFTIDGNLLGYTGGSYETDELIKIGLDAAGNPITETKKYHHENEWTPLSPLAGAVFGLWSDSSKVGTTEYYTNTTFPGTVTSDANGRLKITGLDEGTYYLKEISAPTGFIADNRTFTITIAATYQEIEGGTYVNSDNITVKYDKYKVLDSYTVTVTDNEGGNATSTYDIVNKGPEDHKVVDKATYIQMTGEGEGDWAGDNVTPISNTQGTQLPSTGGMGTTILYVGGSILVILAAILLITKRRMNAED